MKKYIIPIITILIFSITISCFAYKVQAVGLDALSDPSEYTQSTDDNTGVASIGSLIVGVVRTVGNTIAVLMLTVIGIKYLIGSVEEKAEYKQSMWPYILGAVLIFAGANITTLIYNIMNSST